MAEMAGLLLLSWLALWQANVQGAAYNGRSPPVNARSVPEPVVADVECTNFPCLVFDDNFDTLDFNNWQHEITLGGGGNWEFEYYTNNRSNSYVRDGNLYLKPTLTEDVYGPGFVTTGVLNVWGASPANLCTGNAWYGCERAGTHNNIINPIQSARLRSVQGFNIKYGRIEIQAQMPKGDWIWPALWLLPTHNEYGDWPASGEIDMLEIRGNSNLEDEQGNPQGNTEGGAAMHWGPWFSENRYFLTTGHKSTNYSDNMHTFTMTWDEDHILMEFDGTEVMRVTPDADGFWGMGNFGLPPSSNPWSSGSKMAPFDKPFYIIMNVAVGGSNGYFPDGWTNQPFPKPWLNTSPTALKDFYDKIDEWYPTWNPDVDNGESAAMKVNYVRAWKLRDN